MDKLKYNKPEAKIIYTDDVIVTSDPKMSTSNNLYDEANR